MSHLSYKHNKYLMISIYHCDLANKKFSKLSKKFYTLKFIDRLKKIKPLHQYLLKRYARIYKECSDHIDISISMSAFAIEALINFYAIHFELDKLPGYNERIPTSQKWKIYPFQKTGSYLSHTTLDMVQEVLNDRNEIAHYKPSTDPNIFSGHSLKTAFENLNKVYKIYENLNSIDLHMKLNVFQFEIPEHADRMIMEYVVNCDKSWKTTSL